jgi:hypothetical protein
MPQDKWAQGHMMLGSSVAASTGGEIQKRTIPWCGQNVKFPLGLPWPPVSRSTPLPNLCLLSFLLAILGFELKASHLLNRYSTTWVTPPALFCTGYFWHRVSWTICLGWLQTTVLLISASQVARITGVSHQCPAVCLLSKATLPSPEGLGCSKWFRALLQLSLCL